MRFVSHRTTGRQKLFGPFISRVVFLRLQIVPIGSSLRPFATSGNQSAIDTPRTSFGQQPLDDCFRLFVIALAILMMSNTAQIVSQPTDLIESLSYGVGK